MSFFRMIGPVKQNIINVLKHPEADPRLTLLVFGIFTVIVLILISLLLLIYFIIESRVKKREEIERKRISLRTRLIVLGIMGFIILASLSAFFYATSQPSFCIRCHIIRKDYIAWKQSSHKQVNCLICHSRPGTIGYLVAYIKGAQHLERFLRHTYKQPLTSSVNNEACLVCHQDITQGVTTSIRIRVSHREFLAKGYLCTDCHSTVAHSKAVPLARHPSMDKCIICHKGKSASSACSLCHLKNVDKAISSPIRDFPKVQLGQLIDCRGCHSVESCTACHGVEMPHPPEWTEQQEHARYSAFEKKEICWKCHEPGECYQCHSTFAAHGPDWKRLHSQGADRVAIEPHCMRCHSERRSPHFCALCH